MTAEDQDGPQLQVRDVVTFFIIWPVSAALLFWGAGWMAAFAIVAGFMVGLFGAAFIALYRHGEFKRG